MSLYSLNIGIRNTNPYMVMLLDLMRVSYESRGSSTSYIDSSYIAGELQLTQDLLWTWTFSLQVSTMLQVGNGYPE